MSLLLCRREKVKHPFYIEVLGIHIYSSQELCYVIYHHPLLVMNDFVDASLFFFVKNELGLGFLAGRMEKLVEAGGRPEEALYLFLSECDYYTEKEIQKFKQVTASYRNLSQNAYGKAVADYLFSQKQYGKALQKYEKLTEEGERKKGEEAFWSQVYQNLGAACAQMFQFSRHIRHMIQPMVKGRGSDPGKDLFSYLILLRDFPLMKAMRLFLSQNGRKNGKGNCPRQKQMPIRQQV